MMLVYENILVEHTQFYWFLSGLIILFVINLLPIFIYKYKDNIFLCTVTSYSIIFFTIQQIKEQFMALFYILMEVLYGRQYSWFHYRTISLPYQIWKKLADYVFSHTAETQYLSITSLAENCDVSEATITRFCRGLGPVSYTHLYDNNIYASVNHPPITTIAFKSMEIGEKAAEILVKLIRGEKLNSNFNEYLYQPSIVERESCLGKGKNKF